MKVPFVRPGLALLLFAATNSASASVQTFPTNDPVIRNMWDQGMGSGSQVERLAQVLTDSIGPRLIASPGYYAAVDWALKMYDSWGIPARVEQYGTWSAWRRGHTRLDLIAPHFRTLTGTMLAWSPNTQGPIEGDVVVLPDLPDSDAYERWLRELQGKFILITPPEPTCRPFDNLVSLALPETVQRIRARRDSVRSAWSSRYQRAGARLGARLDGSRAAGILTSFWSGSWGVNRVMDTDNTRSPSLDISCEDNGLLHRLAENQQGPRVRLDADSEALGEQPVFNVVAELRGRDLPDEYVVLSAHLDSWDSSSGATDNATGTLMMMEAMRILKTTYPNPKRTIMAGHWGGEEQGLNGSKSFAADHPEVVAGLQVGFNQDNGTWRIEAIRMQGFAEAREPVGRWLSNIPREVADTVQFESPSREGGSDHSSFTCYGVPFLRLQSNYPDYRRHTWHTNIDTFDKIIFDDLKNNATLTAMLAYQAAEDPQRVPRTRAPLPANAQGQVPDYPGCSTPRRSSTG
ncbi:MAG TPA: peptidase M28 [Gemmatimonadetes bacterium]|nr:peptidase M28 [Gemmatimonadota bacterium]